ncbi:hypothetical protein [Microbacterium esteraromaticum]|nr:hypothetical protein [Microbacterium esteraromaticum]
MTPVERGCLYGIGILSGIIMITRGVDTWFTHLENQYWARKSRA